MIVEQILVTFMAVFCYLVVDEETKEAILIDPAGDFESIMPVVKKHNAKVKYIVNTHGHPDHTSGNGRAAELTGPQSSYIRATHTCSGVPLRM
jgi:glyoxylase-like metal-dependent hydrolase (beta-lactamase superfamily II)